MLVRVLGAVQPPKTLKVASYVVFDPWPFKEAVIEMDADVGLLVDGFQMEAGHGLGGYMLSAGQNVLAVLEDGTQAITSIPELLNYMKEVGQE